MEVYSINQSESSATKFIMSPATSNQAQKVRNAEKGSPVKASQSLDRSITPDKGNFSKRLEIAKQVGEKLRSAGVKIQFEINKDSGRIVINVLDPVSEEVVRKIPPEAFMKSVELISEMKELLWSHGIEIDGRY